MVIGGAAIVAAFFVPWFDFAGLQSASGFTILRKAEVSPAWLAVIGAIPVLGLLVAATAVAGVHAARWLGFGLGLAIIAYGSYRFFQVFFAVTGPGVWLMVCGAIVLVLAALLPGGPARPTTTARVLESRPKPPPTPPVKVASSRDKTTPLG